MSVRVRFAPSPTGPLHIGGVRTALYNYLFARKNNGTFILRIEDTDQSRYVSKAEEYIIESLKWCGLNIDEGVHAGGDYSPYRQSERTEIYQKYAQHLIDEDKAYYAFDTPEELEKMRENMKKQGVPSPQYNAVSRQYMKNSLTLSADEVKKRIDNGDPYVIRLKVPRKEEIKVKDIIRGWVVFHSNQLDDKVLLKADGLPTYHMANVIDDHLMEITHVIRGEEWLPSTPVHVLLYEFLGWKDDMPEFAHLPLILRPDGNGKLSKRDGELMGFPVYPLDWYDPKSNEKSSGYRETGFFPEAFLNMLAFLGWNPGTSKEIFSPDELVSEFSLERVGKAGAKFDYEKAKWFNQQHIRLQDNRKLAELLMPMLEDRGEEADPEYLTEVCGLLKERMIFITDFWEHGYFFFEKPIYYAEKVIKKKWNEDKVTFFESLKAHINKMQVFNEQNLEELFKKIMESHKMKFGDVLPLFRIMLSGTASGPPLFAIGGLLGKEETLERIRKGLEEFDKID